MKHLYLVVLATILVAALSLPTMAQEVIGGTAVEDVKVAQLPDLPEPPQPKPEYREAPRMAQDIPYLTTDQVNAGRIDAGELWVNGQKYTPVDNHGAPTTKAKADHFARVAFPSEKARYNAFLRFSKKAGLVNKNYVQTVVGRGVKVANAYTDMRIANHTHALPAHNHPLPLWLYSGPIALLWVFLLTLGFAWLVWATRPRWRRIYSSASYTP